MNNKNEVVVSEENILEMTRMGNLYDKVTQNITNCLNSTSKSFVSIGYWFLKLNQVDLSFYGYSTIFDYAKDVFGLGQTSVKNMVAVANKFCDFDNYYSQYDCVLKKEYEGFSYSQLVELLSVDELDMKKFDSSMPVAQIRENKILLKVENVVGDVVDQHIQIIESKLIPMFHEPSHFFEDEDGSFCLLNLNDNFKFKKSKLEKDICDWRVKVELNYKCYWTSFKDCYFIIHYDFYDTGDTRSIGCSITSDFKDWNNYLKKLISVKVDLNDLSSLEEKVKAFVSDYIKFLVKYESKKQALEQAKEKTASAVKESEDLYKELISIPNFKFGDYAKRIKNYSSLEGELSSLKKYFDIKNDSILSVEHTYSYMYLYLYLNLIDDYYVRFNYSDTLCLYKRITVEEFDSKNNPAVNDFVEIDYHDKKFIDYVMNYLRENIKTIGQTSNQ